MRIKNQIKLTVKLMIILRKNNIKVDQSVHVLNLNVLSSIASASPKAFIVELNVDANVAKILQSLK